MQFIFNLISHLAYRNKYSLEAWQDIFMVLPFSQKKLNNNKKNHMNLIINDISASGLLNVIPLTF